MKTAQEREADFRREFAELLARHCAELEVTDDRKPWGMHSGIARITMDSKYIDGALVEDFTEFLL